MDLVMKKTECIPSSCEDNIGIYFSMVTCIYSDSIRSEQ